MNRSKRIPLVLIILILLALASLTASIFTGSAEVTFREALQAIFGKGGDMAEAVMWKIRLPRAFAALILGGSLALSGYLMQTFFANPIAGPFVLGVSSGAKLTVALVMIGAASGGYILSSLTMIAAAFAGSLISLGFVLAVSQRVKSMSMLVVCGVMIGYICSAITDLAVTFADDSDIVNLRGWSLGTFSGMTMGNIAVMAAVTAFAFTCAFLLSKPISAYLLGESYAKSLGVNILFLRAALILLSGLLAACVTAFAGPVSFVGIAVPHLVRSCLKTSKPIILIPACFLGGGIFCIICDIIARSVLSPAELSISTVTAVFGAPVVIAIMIGRKRGELR